MRFETLSEWLDWQQGLHPRAIDLGLDRVRRVGERLGALSPGCPVFTVAGTNGKGSCVAFLEGCLRAAGYRTGAYTSPHLLRYNERIRIDGVEIDDQSLIEAFARVDAARQDESLTYFEFGTLAAFDLFRRAGCEAWVLEVGLGGRLDAVNIIDADVALISSVGLDHTDWLGPDREHIGAEKAGVFRAGRRAIFGGADVPQSVLDHAGRVGAPLWLAGRDYRWQRRVSGWDFIGPQGELRELPLPGLQGAYQLGNAATALAALQALSARLPVPRSALELGITQAWVAGRFQVLAGPVEWILDVAHNRDSVENLRQVLAARPTTGRTLTVFAQMQRKELEPVLAAMAPAVDAWYLLELPDADVRPAADVAAGLAALGIEPAAVGPAPRLFEQVAAALQAGDRLVVFGSFRTVEEALRHRELPATRVL